MNHLLAAAVLLAPSLASGQTLAVHDYNSGSYGSISDYNGGYAPYEVSLIDNGFYQSDELVYTYEIALEDAVLQGDAPSTQLDPDPFLEQVVANNGFWQWYLGTTCATWFAELRAFRPTGANVSARDVDAVDWMVREAYAACRAEDSTELWADELAQVAAEARRAVSAGACEASITALYSYGSTYDSCNMLSAQDVERRVADAYRACSAASLHDGRANAYGEATFTDEEVDEIINDTEFDVEAELARMPDPSTLWEQPAAQEWWEILLPGAAAAARYAANSCSCWWGIENISYSYNHLAGLDPNEVTCDPGYMAELRGQVAYTEAACMGYDPDDTDLWSWSLQGAENTAWGNLSTCQQQASSLCDAAVDDYYSAVHDLDMLTYNGCTDPSYWSKRHAVDDGLNAVIDICEATGWPISEAQMNRVIDIYGDSQLISYSQCETWDAMAARCNVQHEQLIQDKSFLWQKQNNIHTFGYDCPSHEDYLQCIAQSPAAELFIRKSFWEGKFNFIAAHTCEWVDAYGHEMPVLNQEEQVETKIEYYGGLRSTSTPVVYPTLKTFFGDMRWGYYAGKKVWIVIINRTDKYTDRKHATPLSYPQNW